MHPRKNHPPLNFLLTIPFIFASYLLPSMTHNGESSGSGSPEHWLWPHRLRKEVAKEFVKYVLMVPPGCMLPDSSWGLSEGGMPVPPLSDIGTDNIDDLILHRRNRLPEALKFDPDYVPHYDAWPSILEAERQEQIASYEGPFIPSSVKNYVNDRLSHHRLQGLPDSSSAPAMPARRSHTRMPSLSRACTAGAPSYRFN